jgi:hypothetical protein
VSTCKVDGWAVGSRWLSVLLRTRNAIYEQVT